MANVGPGVRVRLRAPSCTLRLGPCAGTVVRKDTWGDYWIVRLDEPALCHDVDGASQSLTEIREDEDNLEVIEEVPA